MEIETTLYTLHFADDQVAIAQDKDDLEIITTRLFQEYGNWGLSVNTNQTKYLCIYGGKENVFLDNGERIEACDEYRYLLRFKNG